MINLHIIIIKSTAVILKTAQNKNTNNNRMQLINNQIRRKIVQQKRIPIFIHFYIRFIQN